MMSQISPSYLPVTQPIGTFYLTVMKAGLLLDIVDILPRDLTPEGQDRVQREYSEEQGAKIAKFATSDEATFPTSVIVAAYKGSALVDDEKRELCLGRFRDGADGADWEPLTTTNLFKIGEIVDGQHRLRGIEHAIKKLGASDLKDFEMPVVFMLDLNPGDKGYVFSTINGTQRRVNSSLIADLFGLREGRSPRKTCHELAAVFNEWPKGPFSGGLKMLGKKTKEGEMLSQGSFSKYVLRLISRDPDKDDQLLRDGKLLLPDERCPLRELYLNERDQSIARILHEYFSAISRKFETEWTAKPEDFVLRKTVGFAALTRAFESIWDRTKVTNPERAKLYFEDVAEQFGKNLGGTPLTSQYFASNEKGVRDLANALTGKTR